MRLQSPQTVSVDRAHTQRFLFFLTSANRIPHYALAQFCFSGELVREKSIARKCWLEALIGSVCLAGWICGVCPVFVLFEEGMMVATVSLRSG